jgi:hypothetical protein
MTCQLLSNIIAHMKRSKILTLPPLSLHFSLPLELFKCIYVDVLISAEVHLITPIFIHQHDDVDC